MAPTTPAASASAASDAALQHGRDRDGAGTPPAPLLGRAFARRGEGPRGTPWAVPALACALIAAWLLADPRTPDLAAQVYRADLFGRVGFAIFDSHWYAGHHLPGYSLLFPALGSQLGVRAVAALAALCSALLFERIAARVLGGPGARWAAAWFAVAAVGDVWLGRLSFAFGVSFALASVLALLHGRAALAAALAAVCAAASPVAGVLLAFGGASVALERRSPRALGVLAAPVGAVVLPLALLFPEGGWEPYPIRSFAATAVVVLAFLWALPRDQRLLRTGAVAYLLACAACLLIHSPMGSNVERYGVLLCGPLLLGALLNARAPGAGGASAGHGPRPRACVGAVGALALGAAAVWGLWGPVRETAAVAGSEATRAAYYAPLKRFLASAPGGPARVEVPLTRSHWEAALLADSVPLARGWEKQLDERYDRVLLRPSLSAGAYHAWLSAQAVSYVALPDAALDPSSAAEGRMIRAHPAYLQPVFAGAHWRVYRVLDSSPLLAGPGRLAALGNDSFTIAAAAAGSFEVRVRYTRYWVLRGAPGCVTRARDGFTRVRLRRRGRAVVVARFSLARALGTDSGCSGGTAG